MEKTIDPAHEIGENVTITERSQLLSITPEQAKKIKSLRIENQDIDDEFVIFSYQNVVYLILYIFTTVKFMVAPYFGLIMRMY